MKQQTAVEWLIEQYDSCPPYEQFLGESEWEQAKAMEKDNELRIKITCWKEALQFIDNNYMAELINIRIYNLEKELNNL